jgi:hypothetical protein
MTPMDGMFFNGWYTLLRTIVVGVLAYAGLMVLLRISGKRTLAKMNAFDLVVTVALGSTLATIALSADVALAQGLLALALLVALQFVITWSSVRWSWVRRTVTGEPSLLLLRGEFLHAALLRSRVTEEEVRAALRSRGCRMSHRLKPSCSRPTARSASSKAGAAIRHRADGSRDGQQRTATTDRGSPVSQRHP